MNDLWLDSIVCGDALSVLPSIPSGSVDLICADPPYNLGKEYGHGFDRQTWEQYESFTCSWLAECTRILKPTGSIYVFMGVRFIYKLFSLMESQGLDFNGWITWHYTQGMGRTKGFSARHEDILFFTKSADYTFNLDDVRVPQKYYRDRNNMTGANPGDVWSFSHVHYCSRERYPHPTQKPEALIERMIRASSNPGDVVMDPFVGSGTTCRVCQSLDRRYFGIELNPEYAEMSRARLAEPEREFDSADPRAVRMPRNLPVRKRERA